MGDIKLIMYSTLRFSHASTHTNVVDFSNLRLQEIVDYEIEGQGSGFRLSLAKQVGRACGLDAASVDQLADGIEYFHHASLIFDDLPCMDDGVERRGRRCLHRVVGEDRAILAALSLVNRAYTHCWKVSASYGAHCEEAGRLVERCIGELGILDGQERDLSFDASLGAKEVKAIASRKTGALLQLTLLSPATLSGASYSERLRLSRVAHAWGIAYQALDDFSDLLPGMMSTGKTPYQDLKLNRPNLVVALGQSEASAEIKRYMQQADRQINELISVDEKWAFLSYFHSVLSQKEAALRAALEAA
jgi:geranylgeranyl pyrophosphate synthase